MNKTVLIGLMGLLAGTTVAVVNPATASDSDIIVSRPGSSERYQLYLAAKVGNASYAEANDSDVGFDLLAGYQVSELLAIEAGWADMGKVSNKGATAETSLFHLGVLGKLGLRSDVAVFGKAGLAFWDAKFKDDQSSYSDSAADVFFGLGLDYEINRRTAVRFAFDYFSVDAQLTGATLGANENILFYSAGFIFKL